MKKYIYPDYIDRKGRNEYVLKLIKSSFQDTNTILNIGGGQKRYLQESSYNVTEIDIEGDNDLNIDLDKIKKIPLNDESFDTVISLDVLEHLENFHLIFKEMLRLSKKNVIISLPNSFRNIFDVLLNNQRHDVLNHGFYNKFYGLPIQKPLDRHRWFLTISDIERYFKYHSKENNYEVEFMFPYPKSLKSKILSIFLNKRLKREILTKYAWIFIKKI